jgi:intracellular sulfur oxidation DsrE/DsrF family protein
MESKSLLARRSFFSRITAGLATLGLLGAARTSDSAEPQAQNSPAAGAWKAARHAEDDWLEALPGTHRFFLDTTTAEGLAQGIFFANNYYTANRTAYALQNSDLAVVVCLRHQSTPFAFTDAMWAKYGAPLSTRAQFTDPKTKLPPTINVLRATGYSLPNMNVTLDTVARLGVRFAVCQMATRACAGVIAQATGGKTDDIYAELVANVVPNSHMVPAGIVAVNRAQERGYSFSYVA